MVSFSVTAHGNLIYCLVRKMFKPTLYFTTVNKHGIIQMFSTGEEQPHSCKEMSNYTQFVRQYGNILTGMLISAILK
jgi:hypothetical protein